MRRRLAPTRWPLSLQVAVSFVLVTALALWGGGAVLLRQMESRALTERSGALLARSNAAANVAAGLWGEEDALQLALYRFQQQTGVRPVVVDSSGVVVSDSWGDSPLIGQRLTHPEVTAALAGAEQTGTRMLPTGWVMYGAVPIRQDGQIVGAILTSLDLTPLDQSLRDTRRELLLVAVGAGLLAVALGVFLSRFLVRPLERLNHAAGQLAAGRLDTQIELRGSREVAALGQTFNKMAKELARLDQQRRAFVADASHELRTPIASIRALADGLLADRSGDVAKYKEYLGDIAHECERAGRLVDHLLELARLDMRREARTTAAVKEVDLTALVTETLHSLQPLARERRVSLHLDAPGRLDVRTDPRLVATVVGNLVENGLKYTPEGGEVTVSISIGEDRAVRVSVADNGVGIPADKLPHIFERFYRVDKARSRATGGAGLGLAIAAEAASLMGGRIEVESEVGKGSCFTLILPA